MADKNKKIKEVPAKKQYAIRTLKRRSDGTMGVQYVDAATGLPLDDLSNYQVVDTSDNPGELPNTDDLETTEDSTNTSEPDSDKDDQGKSTRQLKADTGGSDHIGSIYENDDVFNDSSVRVKDAVRSKSRASKVDHDTIDNEDDSPHKGKDLLNRVAKDAITTGLTSGSVGGALLGGALGLVKGLSDIGKEKKKEKEDSKNKTDKKESGKKGTISNYDDTGVSDSAKGVAKGLADRGYQDLGVNSGYRDKDTNKNAGGAKHSQHLEGNALDLATKGLTDKTKADVLDSALSAGAKGIGIYPSGSMHVDTRETPAMWGVNGSYNGAKVNQMPAWAQDNLQALQDADGYQYLSKDHVPSPTARPEQEPDSGMKTAQAVKDQAASDKISPAAYAAQGYAPRTPEERQQLSYALAGELSPRTLEALAMGDPQAISEASDMIGALENRAVTHGSPIAKELDPTQVNSMDPTNQNVTAGNYKAYKDTIDSVVNNFYDGKTPDTLTQPNATHWANLDLASPDWAPLADTQEKVGDHTFFSGLKNTFGRPEYNLNSFDSPIESAPNARARSSINDTVKDSWTSKASNDIASSPPSFSSPNVNDTRETSHESRGISTGDSGLGSSSTAGRSGTTETRETSHESRGLGGSASSTSASTSGRSGNTSNSPNSGGLGGSSNSYSSNDDDGVGGRTDGWT